MAFVPEIPVTVASVLAATAGVVAGGPLFADGLRTLRLRRALARLVERPLTPDASGLVLVGGRVALESPLFSPLAGRPCAGYVLDVRGEGTRVGARIESRRDFRLVADGASARVRPGEARWSPPVIAERRFSPDESPSAGLAALLERNAETRWLRARRVPLVVTERAFEPGASVHVLGHARVVRVAETPAEARWLATGTDDAYAEVAAPAADSALWIEPDDALGEVVVSERPIAPIEFAPAAWRASLALAGPVVSLAGLLALARAAGTWIGSRS